MPKMAAQSVPDKAELTPYAVTKESWITDGHGHSQLRTPAGEGEDPVLVELHPKQAEYLIASGQIEPIPGITRGYPTDTKTGEPLKLTPGERVELQDAPPLGQLTGNEENVLGEGQRTPGEPGSSGQETQAVDLVDATQTGGEETLKPTDQEPPVDTGAPTETKPKTRKGV